MRGFCSFEPWPLSSPWKTSGSVATSSFKVPLALKVIFSAYQRLAGRSRIGSQGQYDETPTHLCDLIGEWHGLHDASCSDGERDQIVVCHIGHVHHICHGQSGPEIYKKWSLRYIRFMRRSAHACERRASNNTTDKEEWGCITLSTPHWIPEALMSGEEKTIFLLCRIDARKRMGDLGG